MNKLGERRGGGYVLLANLACFSVYFGGLALLTLAFADHEVALRVIAVGGLSLLAFHIPISLNLERWLHRPQYRWRYVLGWLVSFTLLMGVVGLLSTAESVVNLAGFGYLFGWGAALGLIIAGPLGLLVLSVSPTLWSKPILAAVGVGVGSLAIIGAAIS